MPVIVPRWEWRTFGSRFGTAEDGSAALTPGAIQESDEIYLLGGSGDNVKIRVDLMDIKVLRETDADGLERWEPVMKAGFPLAKADVGRVFDALRLDTPPLDRGHVHARPVHRGAGGGGQVPRSTSTSGGSATRSTGARPRYRHHRRWPSRSGRSRSSRRTRRRSCAAVRAVGLAGYLNTNYPRGLTDLLAGAPPRFAVIDVGTNSIKFHVGERRRRAWLDAHGRSCRGHPARGGPARRRRDQPGGAGAGQHGHPGHGRRGEDARGTRDRRRRHRGRAHGGELERGREADPRADRPRPDDHLG